MNLGVFKDHTVFLYLDPFGLKGCEFSVIEPFLKRDRSYSTEIVVNLSMPIMYRLAAKNAVAQGRIDDPRIQSFHKRLSQVLGGDYWKEILWDSHKNSEEMAHEVMSIYRGKIVGLDLPRAFSGSCPVRERSDSRIKYFITFYSRHEDAMLLMNDAMCNAYNQRMHEASTEGTLFEQTNWQDSRNSNTLRQIVLNEVGHSPIRSRKQIWTDIVQKNFMMFTASEYKKSVKKLVDDKVITFEDVRGTARLNDDSRLIRFSESNK